MAMRALSVVDHLFLTLETQKQPMNVAGLCIFEMPEDAGDDFLGRLIDDMKEKGAVATSPFNQILHQRFFWKTDENFDVNHHFHHVNLPSPAGMNELLAYVSKEHARIMDRKQPLWELHLITGIAPESEGRPMRFAQYLKIHHSMVDGIAGMRLIQGSLSPLVDEGLSAPLWALNTRQRNKNKVLPVHQSAIQIAKEQFSTLKPVYQELRQRFRDKAKLEFTSTFDAPPSLLNQKIGTSRRVLTKSLYKPDFVAIAKHFNVTTNDVILAVCGGALRRYLISQNALPEQPLIAFVPISLRKDDSVAGNQLSFLLANLGTHQQDCIDRLYTVSQSMQDGKDRFGRMSQAQIVNYSLVTYGWAFVNLLTAIYPKKQAFNLIISSIPGANTPLYMNGARLSALYPASVLLDGQALNITLANYQDTIDVGVIACDMALPDIDKLLDFIDDELLALQACKDKADM